MSLSLGLSVFLLSTLLSSSLAFFLSPLYHETVYVNQSYAGAPQNGEIVTPYISLTQALGAISDSSPDKRYRVLIEAGTYTESPLHLVADVFLVGGGSTVNVVLDSDFDVDHSSWSTPTNKTHAAGLYGISLSTEHVNDINFTSSNADFFLYDTVAENAVHISSTYANTRTFIANSLFYNTLNVQGTITTLSNVFLSGPGINIYSSTNFTQFIATGGEVSGSLNATWTDPDAPLQLLLPRFDLLSQVTLSGANCNATINRYHLVGSQVFLQDDATVTFYE